MSVSVSSNASDCDYHFSNGSCYVAESPCLYVFANGTCYETFDPLSGSRFDFLVLNPDDPGCLSPTDMLLWLATFNMFAVVSALALGSTVFRWGVLWPLCRWFLQGKTLNATPYSYRITGSVLINVGASVGAAFLLRSADLQVYLPFLVCFWLARPPATPIVIWLVLFDMGRLWRLDDDGDDDDDGNDDNDGKVHLGGYFAQALETAEVDTWIAAVSLYPMGSVADATAAYHKPPDMMSTNYLRNYSDGGQIIAYDGNTPEPVATPYYIAEAGSIVGLVTAIVMLAFAVVWWHRRSSIAFRRRSLKNFKYLLVFFGLHLLRCLSCWFLWAGVLFANRRAFCPSHDSLLKLMGIMMGMPIIDNLWRGFTM